MGRAAFCTAMTLCLALVACSRSSETSPTATMGTVGSTSSASAGAASSAQVTAAVDASPSSAGTWTGHYTASPGPFYMPDGGEWAGVRFRGEDASVGLGAGNLSVTVDRLGHVQGTLDGPLGPLDVRGELTDDAFGATLVSADPASGFAGTAVGHEEGGRIAGTMRLSLPTGNVIREAPFTLALDRKR